MALTAASPRSLQGVPFAWPVRVYYEDTDAAGLVYYANYLRYLERARTEFLRAAGFEQDRLAEQRGLVFVVRSLRAEYLTPARFNDELEATCTIERLRRASVTFAQQVRRADEVCCDAQVLVACFDTAARRARAIPDDIAAALGRGFR